eukprot:gnl/TRDRNA2_/TRDRNA2_164261_c0_seq1.p1 gnl/TRDRNA2_/TRDRNA2_164261_c0~~gnl/TRDRNA2_/TRDRNA2_164261_c0_seq1.p1  ORF type:complete len:367 (+),score=59.37 gnl/TRDRNA2_/TRDRNA2_164261_c0_seq1:523-1623(+)
MWSYANMLHWPPEELMAGCAAHLRDLWPQLKSQEISNALWAFERLGSGALTGLVTSWLSSGDEAVVEGILANWSGEQLLKLTAYVEKFTPGSRARDLAVAVFGKRYLDPVCAFLGHLPCGLQRAEYTRRLRSFELFHLGPHFTPRALHFLDLSLEEGHDGGKDTFRAEAIAALLRHYLDGETAPAVREPALLHGGQTTSRWIAAEIHYEMYAATGECVSGRRTVQAAEIPKLDRVLVDFGAGKPSSNLADDEDRNFSRGGMQAADAWPWSAPLVGDVGRHSHCECVAVAEMLASPDLRALGLVGPPSVAGDISGRVRLFTTHYPCLSCLGILSQFRRRFPKIQIGVGYMEWCDWQKEMARSLASRG